MFRVNPCVAFVAAVLLAVPILSALCATSNAEPMLPVMGWLFDEGTGSTAEDYIGSYIGGNDGTLEQGAGWSSSTPFTYAGNSSLSLGTLFDPEVFDDRSADRVALVYQYPFGSQGSYQAWLRQGNAYSDVQYLIDTSSPRTFAYYAGHRAPAERVWNFYIGGVDVGVLPLGAIPFNTWTHLVVTWDSSLTDGAREKIYVNGNPTPVATFDAVVPSGSSVSTYLGANRLGASTLNPGGFLGEIDEFAIWDFALSADDVGWLYENSLILDIPDPIPSDANGDWQVDGEDATILADNWQQTIAGGASVGDFDGDGDVGDADATIMAANWGVGVAAQSVPEPATLSLLGIGAMALLIGFSRTRKN